MTNRTKTIRGISFDEEILNKIDEERGIASRSAFVNHLMRKALTEQE
jgi:metal-responsive CopG/Arc/MetJ family transcriptional regulator